MPTMIFVAPDGTQTPVDVPEGHSVLQAAWDNKIDIEGACEGCMACSTCHVIVDEPHFAALPDPSDEEEDLLDLAIGVRPTSRLGCQVTVTAETDGMVITLPATTNNQM
ncbi:MAG: ferredoxin family 2Fe-2S iron-sulfur cluster binding protein [Alphaproteobacteria bacterium]|jgi:2Fe-2S ferredoxin|nr:ferredoxin family 2Fe-2S iron-sulfur cluster binding protein [Alphaproteobacteria bacterium]